MLQGHLELLEDVEDEVPEQVALSHNIMRKAARRMNEVVCTISHLADESLRITQERRKTADAPSSGKAEDEGWSKPLS